MLAPIAHPLDIPPLVKETCITIAASDWGVNPFVIKTLLKGEAGKIGTISKNSNGSFDLGPMQINTDNLKLIKRVFPQVTWRHIAFDPCINIWVGTWFLKQKINGRNGNVWAGVGDYHSRTPVHHNRYVKMMKGIYNKVVDEDARKYSVYQQKVKQLLLSANNK